MGYVRKLLSRGANVNYINKLGKTCLHYAVENTLKENTIRYLLNEGANPHVMDTLGKDVCDYGKSTYSNIKEF